MPLRLEARPPDGTWTTLAVLNPGDPPRSVYGDQRGDGRDVCWFSCHGLHSVITRAVMETGCEAARGRAVMRADFKTLATLGPGQVYVMDIRPRRGTRATIRWTHE